jgi:tetratricopeptide (TPR) repeat protein
MDRERLKEVHQSDLTEGRINQDFLDWLRTKGMSWLLVILVALCVYFGMIRWQNYRTGYQTGAWTDLAKAKLPTSLEEVADKYPDVGAVAHLARLRAADELLQAVQTGKSLGATTEAQTDLTHQQRAEYLDRADRDYAKVVEADNQSVERTLLTFAALNGRAAVAESKGQADQARQYYEQAARRSEQFSPKLAEQARERAATVDEHVQPVTLPSREQLALAQDISQVQPFDPVSLEPWVRELVLPAEVGEGP